MFKGRFVLFLFLIVALLHACEKPQTELVIIEDAPPKNVEKIHEEPEALNDGKPVLMLSSDDVVEILVRDDGAPGMYLDHDGELKGFYVDLERMVMEQMGQRYHLNPYSDVGPAVQGLKSGIYHSALATPDLPDYRSFLNLSIPYETLNYVIFVNAADTGVFGDTRSKLISGLHGKRVGVQTRGHIYQRLRDIREIELIEYPTTTKALEDLNLGLLDAVPDVKRIGLYYAGQNGWNILPVGGPILSQALTTSFSKRVDTSLVDRYNEALGIIISDGRFDRLYERYFGQMTDDQRP